MNQHQRDVARQMRSMLLDPSDEVALALVTAIRDLGEARDAVDGAATALPSVIGGNQELQQISTTLSDAVYWEIDEALEAVRAVLLRHLGRAKTEAVEA